jgi:hypothetical protein
METAKWVGPVDPLAGKRKTGLTAEPGGQHSSRNLVAASA